MNYNYNNISLIDIDFNKYENKILLEKIMYISFIGIVIILNIINYLTKYILNMYIPLITLFFIVITIIKYIKIIKKDKLISYLYSIEEDIKYIYIEKDKVIVKYKTKKNDFKKFEMKNYKIIYTNEDSNLLDIINNKLYLKTVFTNSAKFEYLKPIDIFVKESKKNLLNKLFKFFIFFEIFILILLRNFLLFLLFSFIWLLIFAIIYIVNIEKIEEKYRIKELKELNLNDKLYLSDNNFYFLNKNIYKKLDLENFKYTIPKKIKKIIINIEKREINIT